MFYPADLLKKGGRFYLCWVADSWPNRFATITQRQLWSQDIRKLCDELLVVMNSETGRPMSRFSLRLSSQLLRGLVRLYQRKANVLLSDLCMINATVLKRTHKKWGSDDEEHHRAVATPRAQLVQITAEHELELRDERVEEMIQQSTNIVSRIQDITLKEVPIPEIVLPQNDNFGEENPDAALHLLRDRTLELMLGNASVMQHSEVELPCDVTDKSHNKSHDKSRVERTALMEPISELDATLFRKSIGADLMQASDFEKDVPPIPDPILYPDAPVPQLENDRNGQLAEEVAEVPVPQEPAKEPTENASDEIVLEELEEPLPKRRRLKKKLIVDHNIILSSDFLRSRVNDPRVELRCEDSIDDVIEIKVPAAMYFLRPAHAGCGSRSKIANELTRLFLRNADYRPRGVPLAEREMEETAGGAWAAGLLSVVRLIVETKKEEALDQRQRRQVLEKIVEEQEPIVELQPTNEQAMLQPEDLNVTMQDISVPRLSKDQNSNEMLTQKLESPPQEMRKRTEDLQEEYTQSPKKPRLSGYISFKESQKTARNSLKEIDEVMPLLIETDKENVPPMSKNVMVQQSGQQDAEKSIISMLHAAGLADIVEKSVGSQETSISPKRNGDKSAQRAGSESSETQLGSLDRTKVSLGDSETTTDSKRFIRDNWGTEGTMIKIMKFIKDGRSPVSVESLIANGPVIAGYKKIILARCFTSILKLKQHGFIKITKDPKTLEILDLKMGPQLE